MGYRGMRFCILEKEFGIVDLYTPIQFNIEGIAYDDEFLAADQQITQTRSFGSVNLRAILCTEYGEKNFGDSFVKKQKQKKTKEENELKMGNPGGWAINWRAFGCCGGRDSQWRLR